jgi:excisionase family DNA binding protein
MDANQLLKKRLLKTTDLAKILNMDVRSVRQLVERNEIPFIRVNRWHLRFDPDAIDTWLEERTGIKRKDRAIWVGRRRALAERRAELEKTL